VSDLPVDQPRPGVVLVHGLWFGPWSLALLARRLRRTGFEPRSFRYRTTAAGLDEHARALRQFVGPAAQAPLHFVAQSLGGLVVLKMLGEFPDLPGGRVVLLGSPLQGSVVARKSSRLPGGRRLLGAARPVLEAGFAALAAEREIGMVAGSRALGLGLLLGGTRGSGDGTVAVAETRAEGFADHRVLPVTHTGMLFSRSVARSVCHFLQNGRFDLLSPANGSVIN
jgi:pimeloyl-ACP methyl ester carboxylesterase